jgi:hypothetical protein
MASGIVVTAVEFLALTGQPPRPQNPHRLLLPWVISRYGIDRCRGRKTVPTQATSRRGHFVYEAGAPQGRHRKFSLAGTLENVAGLIDRSSNISCLAGYTDGVFHFVVARL